MPLRVTRRTGRGDVLTIDGTVNGRRIQKRASSNTFSLALEEAAVLEARMLRESWHGPKKGSRHFSEAIISYCDAKQRSPSTRSRLKRILTALGDPPLDTIDQDVVTKLRDQLLRPGAKPATVEREIATPIRAVLRHAAARRWCDPPVIPLARQGEGRTRCMTPVEAQRLIDAAAPHLRPLMVFLLGTGCRLSEALQLDWSDVRLADGVAIVWADATKTGKRRDVKLVPRAMAALSGLPHRSGAVFRKPDGKPYPVTRDRGYGGQIKTGWHNAVRRAGLDPKLSPHDCRHSWASWRYCVDRDPLRLMWEGGWSNLKLVARYAHIIGSENSEAIRTFFRDQVRDHTDDEAAAK